jgi:Type II CAAX prenyl endopeptidase Rce1-like
VLVGVNGEPLDLSRCEHDGNPLPRRVAVDGLGIAVFEETVFRGYVFQVLERRWGSGVARARTRIAKQRITFR